MNGLRLKSALLESLATVALSVFSHSLSNCCFLATYEPKIPAELEKMIQK